MSYLDPAYLLNTQFHGQPILRPEHPTPLRNDFQDTDSLSKQTRMHKLIHMLYGSEVTNGTRSTQNGYPMPDARRQLDHSATSQNMWLDDGFGEVASAQYLMDHSASLGLSLSSSDFAVSPSLPYIHVTPPSAALLDSNIDCHSSPPLSVYGNSPPLAQPLKNFPVTYDAANSNWRADAQLDLLALECMSNDASEWTKLEEPQMTASHWAEMALTSAPHGHLDVSASNLSRSLSPLDQLFSIYPDSGSTSPYSSAPQSPSSQATRTYSRSSSICSTSPPPLTRQPIADSSSSQLPSSSSSAPTKACTHCKATTTPLWRRDPTTQNLLCNACGLYLQHRHVLRPQVLIDADAAEDEDEALPAAEWTGPECSHCHTRNTSVWRRSKEGAQVCNACGVYQRLRGKPRPLRLKRNRIKPRTRRTS